MPLAGHCIDHSHDPMSVAKDSEYPILESLGRMFQRLSLAIENYCSIPVEHPAGPKAQIWPCARPALHDLKNCFAQKFKR